jgi:hypothetical protein
MRWVLLGVLLAAPLVLAGCSSVNEVYHAVADPVQTAFSDIRHAVSARIPSSSATPSAPAAGRAESTTQTQSPPAPDPAPTPKPEVKPVVVNGLSEKAVQTLLGQPAAKDGPAPGQTWTYRSGSCEVELFLFPDVTQGSLHVLDYRVSGAGSKADEQQACLRRVSGDRSG